VDTNTDIPAFTDTPALEPPPLLEVELLDEVFADPLVEVPAPDDVAVPVVCVAAPCPWVFVPVDGVDEDLPPPPQAAIASGTNDHIAFPGLAKRFDPVPRAVRSQPLKTTQSTWP
jgi:hypothetical protein